MKTPNALHRPTPRLAALWMALGMLLAGACQPTLPVPGEPETAAEWLAASARHHDPAGLWALFAGEVSVGSAYEDGVIAFRQDLYIDRGADTFRRSVTGAQAILVQTASPSGCRATYPVTGLTEAERRTLGLIGDPCAAILPRRRLQEFLLGLPMSALTPRTQYTGPVREEEILGQETVTVDLVFADDPGGQAWHLHLDPETAELRAVAFDFSDGSGELIDYGSYVDFEGFRLAGRRTFYRGLSGDFVIDERLTFTPIE